MYYWRVTKYNPKFRDKNGSYCKEEWTSFSDIGKIFEKKELTLDQYSQIESIYLNAISLFLIELKIPYLKIIDLEKNSLNENITNKYKELYPDSIIDVFNTIENNEKINFEKINLISKLVLREHIWLKLEYENNFFIHFGYDYYLYIGSSIKNDMIIDRIVKLGLYVEDFKSPYLD